MYWLIEPLAVPRIRFAHAYETDRYRLHFPVQERLLELSYLKQGDVVRHDSRGERLLAAPGLVVNCFQEPAILYSKAPLHRHSTVGLEMPYALEPIEPSRVLGLARAGEDARPRAILPEYLSLEVDDSAIAGRLERLIRIHALGGGHALQGAALALELLHELTQISLRQCARIEAPGLTPGAVRYCQRAMDYIAQHLTEHIAVGEIAGELGISAGYLSTLFHSYTGRTLVTYINQLKLSRVRELMKGRGLTLREAGEAVGLEDEHYLSRIFHRYLGVTARSLRGR